MDTKKKITYLLIVVVLAFFGWQAMDMFGGAADVAQGPIMQKNPDIPKVANLLPQQQKTSSQQPMTEREAQLVRLQQETQAKYIAAVNELQMLKIEKDIAETSRDVSRAKLEGITAQKGIVDLLTPEKVIRASTDSYAQGLLSPGATTSAASTTSTPESTDTPTKVVTEYYSVVSVSKLRGQWIAVLGNSGTLYKVQQGDVLPLDGSVVSRIDRNGVQLEKDGKTTKLSMVPII